MNQIHIQTAGNGEAFIFVDGELQTFTSNAILHWDNDLRMFIFKVERLAAPGFIITEYENFSLTYGTNSPPTTITDLQQDCHTRAHAAGWWDEYDNMPAKYRKHFIAGKIALVHSEVSESLEAFRKNKRDDHLPHRQGVEVEFADAVIRILDLAGVMGLDIAGAITEKMAYNAQRPDHTREARAADGGKSL